MGRIRKQDKAGKGRTGVRTRQVVIAAGIIGAVGAPVGFAATGNGLREGVRNGTATKETQIVGNFGSTTAKTGGFVTRQSNLSSSGGGAVYGCRSGAGGSAATPTPQNPCVRSNNLGKGVAFEFNATSGNVVGLITASGNGGDAVKPFTTNATGVATGLNADRVDGLDAAAIAKTATDAAAADAAAKAASATSRWVLVGLDGQIEAQSGGFRVVTAYPQGTADAPSPARHNVYIDAGEDLTNNGINATISLQNQTNQGGGTMNGTASQPNPLEGDTLEFGGEISAARCLTPGIVACAPAGTASPNVFVVSPRQSDGTGTDPGERKRFYATITG